MIITAKTKSYSLIKGNSHYYGDGDVDHRVAGPAYISDSYNRVWYHKDHGYYFRETGPGIAYLNGDSYHYHIDGKYCSEGRYEDYCKSEKL